MSSEKPEVKNCAEEAMTAPTDRHMEEARRLSKLGCCAGSYPCPDCARQAREIASAFAAESTRSFNDGIEAAAKALEGFIPETTIFPATRKILMSAVAAIRGLKR